MSLVEDPVNPRLLFTGTTYGLHATIDGGRTWFSFALNLPTTSVHDMVIHPREGDLVIGTHGRGIWILDSLAGLRGLTPENLARPGALLGARPGTLLTRFDRGRTWYGDDFFAAPNPVDGVYLDMYLNPASSAAATLELADGAGQVIRRLDVPAARGLQRVVWDMRRDAPPASGGAPAAGGARGAGGRGRGGAQRPLVEPGTYEARLTIDGVTTRLPVIVKPDPGR
jgi:hypothetical protein